ncbi:MAG: hypothetical protein WBM53_17370, partial [Maribacter sp.]
MGIQAYENGFVLITCLKCDNNNPVLCKLFDAQYINYYYIDLEYFGKYSTFYFSCNVPLYFLIKKYLINSSI